MVITVAKLSLVCFEKTSVFISILLVAMKLSYLKPVTYSSLNCCIIVAGLLSLSLGITECVSAHHKKCSRPGVAGSSWKSSYIRQHRIESNWRKGDKREPMVLINTKINLLTHFTFALFVIVA